jgi:hypothetical protein
MTSPRPVRQPWLDMPLPLADELFCVAHDDRTGRCRIHHRVAGLGLAAGLLGELILRGRVDLAADGGLRVLNTASVRDVLAQSTLSLLLAQPQHREVRTWLVFLGERAVESGAERLAVTGIWQRAERHRLGRTRVSYRPTDANTVFWRTSRLARALTSTEPLGPQDAVLAGLVAATGLTDVLLWQLDTRYGCLTRIAAEVKRLPRSLCHLVASTEAAVGDAVLTPR